jgi:16S rRNA processing protein RimM
VTQHLVAVGRVGRAHGVRGEVAVTPLTEVESRFAPGSALLLEDGRRLTVRASRPHAGRLLVRFEETADRDDAAALRGLPLLVPSSELPEIEDEGRFWVRDVVGLEVVTESGRSLGPVREVLANPANDLWVTGRPGEPEMLIPALRDVVVAVDLEARRVVVREVPGLVE